MLHKCFVVGMLSSLGCCFYAFVQFTFLKPYVRVIWQDYRGIILLALAMVCFNVTAILHTLLKGFSMKTTGRKLEHMSRSLHSETSVMPELSERLRQ
jgi:hypothetical protein